MAASFNAKKLAHDITKGLVNLNPTRLKKYRLPDIKALLEQLTAEQRKVRATIIAPGDTMKIKEKNRCLQQTQRAIAMINGYVRKHRLSF